MHSLRRMHKSWGQDCVTTVFYRPQHKPPRVYMLCSDVLHLTLTLKVIK